MLILLKKLALKIRFIFVFALMQVICTVQIEGRNSKILEIIDSPKAHWPNEIPSKSSLDTYKPGWNLEALRGNAIKVYSYYWNLQGSIPEAGSLEKEIAQAVIKALPERIKIHQISEKIAIIEIPWKRGEHLREMETATVNIKSIPTSKDLWVLENDTWYPVFGEYYSNRHIKQIDLNGDGFDDFIIMEVLSDTIKMNVYLNNQNNSVTYQQYIKLFGEFEEFLLTPKCTAKILIVDFANKKNRHTLKFNCQTKRFQP
jgi:hypothetical protein